MNKNAMKQFTLNYKIRNGSTKNAVKAWKRLVDRKKREILKNDLTIRQRMIRDGL